MVLKLAGKAAYDYVKKQLKKKKPKLKRTTEAQNKKFKAKMNKVQKDLQSGSKDKIQAAERKLMEREVCNNPRGCEITQKGKCIGCTIEKVWE